MVLGRMGCSCTLAVREWCTVLPGCMRAGGAAPAPAWVALLLVALLLGTSRSTNCCSSRTWVGVRGEG